MAIISEHLCSLIDDLNEGPSDRSRRDINEWFALDNSIPSSQIRVDEEGDDTDLSESTILDVYLPGGSVGGEENELIQRLKKCVSGCPHYEV
ncbi:hypothetical protein Ac2012v2_004077 [Leucoagaricus gongylophorus]